MERRTDRRTWRYNIVADRWAGARLPSRPPPPHQPRHVQSAFSHFSTDGWTHQRTNRWTKSLKESLVRGKKSCFSGNGRKMEASTRATIFRSLREPRNIFLTQHFPQHFPHFEVDVTVILVDHRVCNLRIRGLGTKIRTFFSQRLLFPQ